MTQLVHCVSGSLGGRLARRSTLLKVVAGCLLAFSTLAPITALAQVGGGGLIPSIEQEERPRPPTPGKKDSPTTLLYYGIAIGLLGLVLIANAIPAKRGHQD